MKHDWQKNSNPRYRNHRRCESCALVEETIGSRRVYHRGGNTVSVLPLKGKQPPCK